MFWDYFNKTNIKVIEIQEYKQIMKKVVLVDYK